MSKVKPPPAAVVSPSLALLVAFAVEGIAWQMQFFEAPGCGERQARRDDESSRNPLLFLKLERK